MKNFIVVHKAAKIFFAAFLFFGNLFATDPKLLAKLQPYVVSIKSRSIVAAYGEVSAAAGTGFIVDLKNGYIITNAHVASCNKVIAEYLAILSSGKEITLKLIYSDPLADVAILQADPKELDVKSDLTFCNKQAHVGTNVLIIGKNENHHFSTQTGVVANPNEIEGHMPQHAMRISLNVQGGGSGSMVYDIQSGKVIGIIFASNMATSAFALPISYAIDILMRLREGKKPKRFSLGAILEYCSLDNLVKYYGFSKEQAKEYADKYPQAFHRALKVESIFPESPADGVLQIGDCILKINGQELGPNLYLLDKTISELGEADKPIELLVIRKGKKIELSLKPYNMNDRQVKRMVVFGGATFFEADDVMIRRSGLKGKNRVLITNARIGSGFIEKLPMFPGSNQALVCVEKLGDNEIYTLNDVIKSIPELMKTGRFTITYRNYGIKIGYNSKIIFNQTSLMEEITVFEQDGMPEEFSFNDQAHNWEIRSIPTSVNPRDKVIIDPLASISGNNSLNLPN